MAKKKTAKRRTYNFTKKSKTRSKRRGSTSNLLAMAIPAMLYGAGRAKIAQAIQPVTSKLPFGQYADEVGMLILTGVTIKKGSGIVKKVAESGFQIENAFVGQQLANGVLNKSSGQTLATSGF